MVGEGVKYYYTSIDEINGFVEGKHELFPIPQTEIDISNLTQNPGY